MYNNKIMTRINCGVPVEELTAKHLIAEHRELVRIPNCVTKGRYNMAGQPKEFKLGTGHVKFFYDKLLYLKNRYESLYNECISRGYNVTYFGSAWKSTPVEFMNDYTPTKKDTAIVRERIKERLTNKK